MTSNKTMLENDDGLLLYINLKGIYKPNMIHDPCVTRM
jgi:hypothetical protein